nr:GntR family transcriptional regulator [Actinomycetales bacterium]
MSADGAGSVPSMVEVAESYIRTKIATGEFVPGYRLKERDLAEEMGISRIPIREAMRSLASEGFVTIVPRRGALVTELRREHLEEIFEVREALEAQESVLAAQRATPAQRAAMRAAVEEAAAAAGRGDMEVMNAANIRFHEILAQSTRNSSLASILGPIKNRFNWIMRQSEETLGVAEEHRALLEAIEAGDTELARALAIGHVRTSKRLTLTVLFPDDDDAATVVVAE